MRRAIWGRAAWATILALAAASPAWADDDCAHRASRDLDLPATGVATLEVLAQAGTLQIRGEPGLTQVRARGVACASREADLAQIRLVQRREGDRLVVAVEMPESSGLWDGQRRLDLELRVPARLALDVSDSSGEASIEGVASLRVQDSSGGLRIANVAGAVRVHDSSGSVDVRDVGSLHVPVDSSGDIVASNVRGDARIDVDSSGSIELRRIGGDARVDQDSSGELRFSGIGGGVTVGNDSSGDIVAEDVGRAFIVRHDGSGGIEHRGVRGEVRIPAR